MGQVDSRPQEYTTYNYASSDSGTQNSMLNPHSSIPNPNVPVSHANNASAPKNYPKEGMSGIGGGGGNTILGTLDAMNEHHDFNMDVLVIPTVDPNNPSPDKTKASPKFPTRNRSNSKSKEGSQSPKKIAKDPSISPKKMAKYGFMPIPPLSISENATISPALDVHEGEVHMPRGAQTTPKNIPKGSQSPRSTTPRSASPKNIFGTMVKAFSSGNVSSTAKSPRHEPITPKLSKSAEAPSVLDTTEVFFTQEDPPKKKSNGKHVTFSKDTNDNIETHVQEMQGVEFPKIHVIPWSKLRDKGAMSEGPHYTLKKVLVYGNVYVQKSINCPEHQVPPPKTVQKLHKEIEILTSLHHHINIVDFVGITVSPANQLSFLTKHCPFSLQGVLDRNMVFDFKGVAYGVLKGIQYVHSCGFVLGDLKPDKIWLDRNETPKLVDFGNALSIKDAIEPNKIVGTIGYMAPEIFLKGAISIPQALDIFSYGAVVHYMVTRLDPAFKVPTMGAGKNIAEVARENANTPFDFSKITEPALRVLLTACLRPNPQERPTTRRALELLSFVKYKWHSDPAAETRRKNRIAAEDEADEENENKSDGENVVDVVFEGEYNDYDEYDDYDENDEEYAENEEEGEPAHEHKQPEIPQAGASVQPQEAVGVQQK